MSSRPGGSLSVTPFPPWERCASKSDQPPNAINSVASSGTALKKIIERRLTIDYQDSDGVGGGVFLQVWCSRNLRSSFAWNLRLFH